MKPLNRSPKDIFFVSVQLLLFVAYIFRIPAIDFSVPVIVQYIGIAVAIAGIVITIAAFRALNKNLSAFPTPKYKAVLVQYGIYKYIRHPIYTGVLSFAFGYALFSENTYRLMVSVLLVVLFLFKASYEEKLLQNKFSDYAAYRKTSGMFLPRV